MPFLFSNSFWKAGLVGGLLAAALVSALVINAWTHAGPGSADAGESPASQEAKSAVAVRVIRPKRDPSFALSVKAPAQVEAYEAADLEAQVAGRVDFIRKAEGSKVSAGELLIQIAVPDLDQEVVQKESVIHQRQAELKLAQANLHSAQAAVSVAAKNVEVAKSAVDAAQAWEGYRGKEFQRFTRMVADRATSQEVADEAERAYNATRADTMRARAMVLKAQADLEESEAKSDAAKVDIQLKAELVDVARQDRQRAQVLADYAKITAPFDGVITHRGIDPGSFVQNATTAHTAPLLRIERQDIITVAMRVPDTFASLVSADTEAVIEMSELPGQLIHGKVTRFSPSLESAAKDHTLPVQVDLFNGTEAEYEQFLIKEKAKKKPFDDLKEGPLPLVPRVTGAGVTPRHSLYPGMYGEMKLVFRHLQNTYLIPSDAIVRQGGASFLYLARDGKAALIPIEVQVDDQRLAKVAIIEKTATGTMKRDLTGEEQVIYSNPSELSDGMAVQAIPQDWKGRE